MSKLQMPTRDALDEGNPAAGRFSLQYAATFVYIACREIVYPEQRLSILSHIVRTGVFWCREAEDLVERSQVRFL
jgi:hypothetical protein